MSSILKALKKVEHDQNISRPNTLSSLSDVKRTGAGATVTKFVLYGLILFALGGGTVYYRMKQPAPSGQLSTPAQPSSGSSAPQESSLPKPVADIQPSSQQTSTSQTIGTPARPKPVTIHPSPISEPKQGVPKTARQQAPVLQSPPLPSPDPAVKPAPPQQISAPPRLEVNGIAYQGENGDSIAVVNGVSVSKRSVIEGVTVHEIHPDRVSFSRGGKIFDVELGKTSRGEN